MEGREFEKLSSVNDVILQTAKDGAVPGTLLSVTRCGWEKSRRTKQCSPKSGRTVGSFTQKPDLQATRGEKRALKLQPFVGQVGISSQRKRRCASVASKIHYDLSQTQPP
jgi:hypothetical protein